MNGNIEIASILIRNGANINQLSKLNKIPLHFAAQNGHLDLAKLLITNGSSLNTLDILKMTPLHW
jgi:ankyrin repeat protein